MSGSAERIRAEIAKCQGRQTAAIAAAILLAVVLALLYAHPGWLGPNAKGTIFFAQSLLIAAFIAFTFTKWRYPACKRYLGCGLHRRACH